MTDQPMDQTPNPFDALGGGGFDMNALLQQAQQMQERLEDAQAQLADTTVEGSVGGVTLRHSAYTWWAMHKPVRSAVRALTRPITPFINRLGSGKSSPVLIATRRASRPTAAARTDY